MAKETVKPSEVLKVPSAKEFTTLVRAVKNADADINDAQGAKSGLIRKAVEKQHLHKKAFSTFQTAARLSNKALSEYMAHLEHYFEVGGLNARASEQLDMIGREAELAETKVAEVETNGHRKKRKDKAAPKGKVKPKGKANVVTFDSQRERESAAQFGEAVDEGAVH